MQISADKRKGIQLTFILFAYILLSAQTARCSIGLHFELIFTSCLMTSLTTTVGKHNETDLCIETYYPYEYLQLWMVSIQVLLLQQFYILV